MKTFLFHVALEYSWVTSVQLARSAFRDVSSVRRKKAAEVQEEVAWSLKVLRFANH